MVWFVFQCFNYVELFVIGYVIILVKNQAKAKGV